MVAFVSEKGNNNLQDYRRILRPIKLIWLYSNKAILNLI